MDLSLLVTSFSAGLFVGLVTCPTCAIPLGAYVAGKEHSMMAGFIHGLLFNSGRLLMFLVFGVILGTAGILLVQDKGFQTFNMVLLNLLILAFSLQLLGIIHLPRPRINIGAVGDLRGSGPGVFLWGLLLGNICAFEFYTIFSAVVLKGAFVEGVRGSLAAALVFGLGTLIPSLAISTLSGGLQTRITSFPLPYLGGVFLLSYLALNLGAIAPGNSALAGVLMGSAVFGILYHKAQVRFTWIVSASIIAVIVKSIQAYIYQADQLITLYAGITAAYLGTIGLLTLRAGKFERGKGK